MPMATAQARQSTLVVLVEVALDGASGDVGVGGDVVVAQAVALEPEDLHLALDAGVGVMVAIVGQGLPVVRREGDRSHDGSTRCCSQVAPPSSLYRCTVAYNLCQTRPRRVYAGRRGGAGRCPGRSGWSRADRGGGGAARW